MRNRPIFIEVKKFVVAQGLTIQQIEDMGYEDVKSSLNLTDDEYVQYCLYAPSIKHVLINNIKERNKQEAINEMVDRFLLSGMVVTPQEARLAIEAIFEDRDLKSVNR